MTLEGTVVDGKIVLDGGSALPEGARVRVEPTGNYAEDWEMVPPPPTTETREEFLASLRESIAAMEAGEKGKSVAEVFDEIDRELGRPANGEG